MKKYKNRGFILSLEAILAMGTILLIISLSIPFVTNIIQYTKNTDTDANLYVLGKSIEKWYFDNSFMIDINDKNKLSYNDSLFLENGFSNNDVFEKISQKYNGQSGITKDGYGNPFKIFISNRIETDYSGVLLPHHTIILLSKGNKPNFESTFNEITGEINLKGNEKSYIISGLDIQKENFNISKDKLNTLAKLYQDYYKNRYISHGADPSVDYFGFYTNSEKWDLNGKIKAKCISQSKGLGVDVLEANIPQEFGLHKENYSSQWGNNFRVLNCGVSYNLPIGKDNISVGVRTPNATGSIGLPPYTAIMGFELPNGQFYINTIIPDI